MQMSRQMRLGETLGDVREEALVNMIAYGLAEVQS